MLGGLPRELILSEDNFLKFFKWNVYLFSKQHTNWLNAIVFNNWFRGFYIFQGNTGVDISVEFVKMTVT